MRLSKKTVIIGLVLLAVTVFMVWRFVRPMNIFVVSPAFERPISTAVIPAPLQTLRATECAVCHKVFYDEWKTTIHSQAWTDPYFQTDWQFEKSQQICRNCHTPLDRQQESKVLGFRDKDKWDPILAPNPDFDAKLQHEGVTCAACHVRDGKILGPYGSTSSPHPVKKLSNPNQVCVRCHVVGGERWDTFFRFPPCGTVAEIQVSKTKTKTGRTGEAVVPNIAALGCVDCHMPLIKRPIVAGGKVRTTRRHWWRGGHDPAMVKRALTVRFEETPVTSVSRRRFSLTITNVGAAHYVPTGTPDRHFSVELQLLDASGGVIKKQQHLLKRNILWRPFIIELGDTRLPRYEPRQYTIDFKAGAGNRVQAVEAVVRYHLLEEKRRKYINYKNTEPIAYEVFRKRISLSSKTK
ncbi:MAG TPA: hypothetical protein ENG78_01365 [Acidiferrobacteraceae bacterium]|nr:hypothetical protein [Acidiferrobacteraceae bacterium]HEX19464.1 hypothetical protein [Acidiferrobacteraceae bacterium]